MPNGKSFNRGDVVGMITRPGKIHIGVVIDGREDSWGEIVCCFWSVSAHRFSGANETAKSTSLDYLCTLDDLDITMNQLGLK